LLASSKSPPTLVSLQLVNEHLSYRLNWFGFTACQDLLDEAIANNEPPVNFGLYDQRNAFFWVQKFIAGFGGDPMQLTAFGESAGSVSLALHLTTSVPLFNRAILQSGTIATVPPVDLKHKEAEYRALLKYCGIAENDPERLRKLREVPCKKLVEAIDPLGMSLFLSLWDENFFTRGLPDGWAEGELIAKCGWVDSVVLGDAYMEVN
jgi:carboxylesterase type B